MKVVCDTHGEQEQVELGGYSLGARAGFHERDMEGISFRFDFIDEGDTFSLELASADGARDYLSKFADWEEKITQAANGEYEFGCPECGNGRLLYVLEDGEEI